MKWVLTSQNYMVVTLICVDVENGQNLQKCSANASLHSPISTIFIVIVQLLNLKFHRLSLVLVEAGRLFISILFDKVYHSCFFN